MGSSHGRAGARESVPLALGGRQRIEIFDRITGLNGSTVDRVLARAEKRKETSCVRAASRVA